MQLKRVVYEEWVESEVAVEEAIDVVAATEWATHLHQFPNAIKLYPELRF